MKLKEVIFVLLQTVLITGVVLLGVMPLSCKVTTEGIEIVGGDYSAPYLYEVKILDDRTIIMTFSEGVKVSNVVVSPRIPGISDSDFHSENEALSPALAAAVGEYGKIEADIEYSEDNTVVTFNLRESTEIGRDYEVFGVVEDRIGNTLTFTAPFSGYNSNIPKLIMTEVQIKYGKGSSGGETIYRGEYVEFLALEDGNLTGIELFSASDGEKKVYQFPNVNVNKGEIFLVHLRTAGTGCVNELENFNEATAPHSKDGVRDLWDENTSARFNDSSDVIILRNRVDGSIMDGIMYGSIDAVEWKKDVSDYAIELQNAGIWSTWEVTNAASSKGCTTLRSLTRQNAKEIFESVMSDEEIEYPLPAESDDWQVESVSPGVL